MASFPSSQSTQSTLWTNFLFIVVSVFLLVSLLYQYYLPWHLSARIIKKHGRDPRPRVFSRFLLGTMILFFCASLLNVVFLAQDVPSAAPSSPASTNEGLSMRVQNLSLGGWIALMVLANISCQLPFALIFLTLVNVLQSRWYAYIVATTGSKTVPCTKDTTSIEGEGKNTTNEEEEHKFPAFLGRKGKEGVSFFLAFLLVFLPVLSRIILAAGIMVFPNPMRAADAAEVADGVDTSFDAFEQLEKGVAWVDGVCAGIAFISVLDIAASSFLLSKRLRASGYNDSITISVLRIFTPVMGLFMAQIVVASAVQTLGPTPAESTLAAIGLSKAVASGVLTTFMLVGLSILHAALPRWMLAAPEEHPYALELPSLRKDSV